MLAPNTILQNRYRIVRKLGEGGMGAIYEAIDQRVSCAVALKETLVGSNRGSREAFLREAALLANLRHACLPKVMDYFGEGDGEFLVMEFIAGHDLLELLYKRQAPFTQVEVINWAIDLLRLLEHLHTHEPPIVHRDIKPANIKLTANGEIFLLDFGLAKGSTGQMLTVSTDQSVLGYTPIYSPLEQILGQGTDPRSDIYSLGASLYHLLTAQPPISASTRFNAIENDQPDPLKAVNQINIEVAGEVATCIQNAMALSRRDRIPSAREMRTALEKAAVKISGRDLARQAEQELIKNLPGSDSDQAKPLVLDENVQFSAYAPEKIKPERNYPVLVFAHLTKRRDDAAPDEPDPLEEVKKQAARVLGEQSDQYRDVTDSSSQPVPRGGELTFVPFVRGLTFNPPSRNFTWQKSVHREEFDVIASRGVDGQALSGSVTVFLGNVVIANIGLSIAVDSQASPAKERVSLHNARSARRVRQVFASYSREDEQIVAELAHVAPLFGSRFLLDRTHLEPGEDRAEGLQRLIRDADVFQLFWSTNSMRAPEIVDEIKYAAALGRPGFILPTYWEEPVPRSPSEGLPPPEIDRLQFYRIYPGAFSQTRGARIEESKVVILGPPGAEVFIDDERQASIGTSGRVILKSISAGQHILRITHSSESDDGRVIEVRTGGGEQVFEAYLKSSATTAAASPDNTKTLERIATSHSPDDITGRVTTPIATTSHELTTGAMETSVPPAQSPPPSAPNMNIQTPDRIRCVICGAIYPASVKFCAHCGSSLEGTLTITWGPQALEQPSLAKAQAQKVAKPGRGKMIHILAGAAIVLMIVFIAPVWLMMTFSGRLSVAPPTSNKNSGPEMPPTVNGTPGFAPDGQFESLGGETLRLRDFQGRVVVLSFWANGSAPSRAEVAVLNALQKKYGARSLSVIGLAKDDDAEQVMQFQKETHPEYLIGFRGGQIESALPAATLPATYIIDRNGRVRNTMIGKRTAGAFEAVIDPLVNENP